MYSWKITKYTPRFKANEWTSVYDVGKIYNGETFELEEYLRIENLYLNAIRLIAKCNKVSFFKISNLEMSMSLKNRASTITEGQVIDLESALAIARKVLREELWCKLLNAKMFVHFGYDYYMYIGSMQCAKSELLEIQKTGLLVETKKSPYLEENGE